jgi:hypothetical protein
MKPLKKVLRVYPRGMAVTDARTKPRPPDQARRDAGRGPVSPLSTDSLGRPRYGIGGLAR